MFINYLNLEYWFYQIYLLGQSISRYLESTPIAMTGPVFRVMSFSLSILFFCLLAYSWWKTRLIRKKEDKEFLAGFEGRSDKKSGKSQEWQDILSHVDSPNESQWKLALIDADKILENLLRGAGYDGDGIGERLKTAEKKGGLKTLQDAWEAHKIRNKIAHESGFILTKRETTIAIESYKKVFEDLEFF